MTEQGTRIMKPWEPGVEDVSLKAVRSFDRGFSDADTQGYQSLTDFTALPDGARVLAESQQWSSRFLTAPLNPYRRDIDVRRSVHRAVGELPDGSPDVLRHEFAVSVPDEANAPPVALTVTIRETIDAMRVDVHRPGIDLLTLPAERRLEAISWLAERVLRLHGTHLGSNRQDVTYTWVFRYRALDEGAHFTTAPEKDALGMWSWADRVDGGITNGDVYFMGFKQISPTDGKLIALDPMHWFDGVAWNRYRNSRPSGGP
ncbi:hypothetical protein LZC95_20350 [Pendulispora brunnea]|uniref:Uncharacterized protein n=1 Tax=Pendulispora brunnea TaxID=2905690 RepID=A0ABZ2KKU1_9BACT